MKKLFEYVGLTSLVLFSFYYTNKVVEIQNEKDPIMVSINEYANEINSKCVEGYITQEGVVLGINGTLVNKELSYSNMKGVGYLEELMVFEEVNCIVTRINNIDYYIVRGNPNKKAISILIKVDTMSYLEQLVNLSENKKIKLAFIVNGDLLEQNKAYFNTLYKSGYDILYSGVTEKDFQKFKEIMKSFDSKYNTFCVEEAGDFLKHECSKSKINTIKTEYAFNKEIFRNVKNTLDKGNLIIFNENKNVVNEFGITVNFIKTKGLDIISIKEHLK